MRRLSEFLLGRLTRTWAAPSTMALLMHNRTTAFRCRQFRTGGSRVGNVPAARRRNSIWRGRIAACGYLGMIKAVSK